MGFVVVRMNFGVERQSSHIRSCTQTTCRCNDCGALDETVYWRADGEERKIPDYPKNYIS